MTLSGASVQWISLGDTFTGGCNFVLSGQNAQLMQIGSGPGGLTLQGLLPFANNAAAVAASMAAGSLYQLGDAIGRVH